MLGRGKGKYKVSEKKSIRENRKGRETTSCVTHTLEERGNQLTLKMSKALKKINIILAAAIWPKKSLAKREHGKMKITLLYLRPSS